MTRSRSAALITAAAALAFPVLGAGNAIAGTTGKAAVVPFTASYSGKATVTVSDQVANITASGPGTGTIIGPSQVSGKGTGDASVQPCVPFTGTGALKANGNSTSLLFKIVPRSEGCGDEAGKVFSVVARAQVTGGAGKLAGASGNLKITGIYDRGAGTFSIKFTGKLTIGAAAPKATVLRISTAPKNRLAFSKKALSAPAGKITIVMKNGSSLSHNVAIRNGVTAKSKIVAKGKVVKKGASSTVKVTLKRGKYRYVCTVSGHEAAGMWGILTVK